MQQKQCVTERQTEKTTVRLPYTGDAERVRANKVKAKIEDRYLADRRKEKLEQ